MKTVFYRPGTHVGIGHIIFAISGYARLADALGARFCTTLAGTLMDFPEPSPLTAALVFDRMEVLGGDAFRERLANEAPADETLVLGRADHRGHLRRDAPTLVGAAFRDRIANRDEITLPGIAEHGAEHGAANVYIQSIAPNATLLASLGPAPSARVRLTPDAAVAVDRRVGRAPFLAIHLRHGNGEGLSGRLEPGSDSFGRYIRDIADLAKREAKARNLGRIICFSDNDATRETLAELSGGIFVGDAGGLPEVPHVAFLRQSPAHESRLGQERLVADFCAIARAACVVGGLSHFPQAAAEVDAVSDLFMLHPNGGAVQLWDGFDLEAGATTR